MSALRLLALAALLAAPAALFSRDLADFPGPWVQPAPIFGAQRRDGRDSGPHSFGGSASLEVRLTSAPAGELYGLGGDFLVQPMERFWYGAGFFFGLGSGDKLASNDVTGRPEAHSVFGFDFRGFARWDIVAGRGGSFYVGGGPALAMYWGAAGATLSTGPGLFIGVEFGRNFRVGIEHGITALLAINDFEGGWVRGVADNGPVGIQITVVRLRFCTFG